MHPGFMFLRMNKYVNDHLPFLSVPGSGTMVYAILTRLICIQKAITSFDIIAYKRDYCRIILRDCLPRNRSTYSQYPVSENR